MSRYALHDHLDDAFKRKFAREQLVAATADRSQGRVDNTAQSMKVKPTQLSAISDLDAHVRANSTTDSSPNSSTDSSPELTDSAPSMVESGAESSAESGAYEFDTDGEIEDGLSFSKTFKSLETELGMVDIKPPASPRAQGSRARVRSAIGVPSPLAKSGTKRTPAPLKASGRPFSMCSTSLSTMSLSVMGLGASFGIHWHSCRFAK